MLQLFEQEMKNSKKTATVHARLEPGLKNSAEKILESLGFSSSQAIQLFYRQVIFQRGLPFKMSVPLDITDEKIVEGDSNTKKEKEPEESKIIKELSSDQWETIR